MLNNNTIETKIIRRELPSDIDVIDDIHPVLARIYQARRIKSKDHLEHTLKQLISFELLSGIDNAINILCEAIYHDQRILIIGDFDADGATSTAVAIRALRQLGAKNVDYLVPNRFEYGYGLTPEIVAVAEILQPDLIITVDNGISSIEGVAAATRLGIKVIVTDHHLPGKDLPGADAIVNPNMQQDKFPSKALAGVGVIFYTMMALRTELRKKAWFNDVRKEPNLASLLDLVALGTVADVVCLDRNNRILVAQGLSRIRQGACCPGIQALITVAGRNQANLVSADLGYAIAPRLNAAGRIQDMSLGIECLLAEDLVTAQKLADKLHQLNNERRRIEREMSLQAQSILDGIRFENASQLPLGICLYDNTWHQGVIGVLASRIKDKLKRPAIIFANAESTQMANSCSNVHSVLIKGSARSVQGVHIRDILETIEVKHPGMIENFGGHSMAAGLSLRQHQFDRFAKAFNEEIGIHFGEEQLQNIILSDGELYTNDYNLEFAQQIQYGGPWGQGFPEPIFDGRFNLLERRIVGESHLKLKLRIPDSTVDIDGIAFNQIDSHWPDKVTQVFMAYKLVVNEFRGIKTPQLLVEHIEPL